MSENVYVFLYRLLLNNEIKENYTYLYDFSEHTPSLRILCSRRTRDRRPKLTMDNLFLRKNHTCDLACNSSPNHHDRSDKTRCLCRGFECRTNQTCTDDRWRWTASTSIPVRPELHIGNNNSIKTYETRRIKNTVLTAVDRSEQSRRRDRAETVGRVQVPSVHQELLVHNVVLVRSQVSHLDVTKLAITLTAKRRDDVMCFVPRDEPTRKT